MQPKNLRKKCILLLITGIGYATEKPQKTINIKRFKGVGYAAEKPQKKLYKCWLCYAAEKPQKKFILLLITGVGYATKKPQKKFHSYLKYLNIYSNIHIF